MIAKFRTWLIGTYLKTISSIAFYPAIISIALFFFAIALLSFEDNDLTNFLLEKAPLLVINNAETARAILATLIGGVISLTVFSFSMVMILLNQASSNFSPRLLPGLISDKRNQIVLGAYIGTIIYNIIVMISILPSGDSYTIQGFSILVGIALGIFCLGLFVFFIHSISTNIQINFILERIYKLSKRRLEYLIEVNKEELLNPVLNEEFGHEILGTSTGYFEGVNFDDLKALCQKHKLHVVIDPFQGKYLLPGHPVFRSKTSIDEEVGSSLKDLIIYAKDRGSHDNYVMGVKQIAEVGIKAMSPGINDPGTAVMTIDYITELLALRMQLSDEEYHSDDTIEWSIRYSIISFEELIYHIMVAYRLYCKHDTILMEKMLLMIKYLQSRPAKNKNYKETLDLEYEALIQDITAHIENDRDRVRLLST